MEKGQLTLKDLEDVLERYPEIRMSLYYIDALTLSNGLLRQIYNSIDKPDHDNNWAIQQVAYDYAGEREQI